MNANVTPRFNPFPGLRPFGIEEDYLFFGREEQATELLGLLREHRFLAVVGTSGSGKSSLVRAGVLPALYGGTMAQAGWRWEVVVLRPGGAPISNLAQSLIDSDLYDAEDDALPRLRATLSRSRLGLSEAIRQSSIDPETNLLVVVDQFEELFRFRQEGDDHQEIAGEFVQLLLNASQQTDQRIYIAITMRSDYLGECAQIPGLAEAVNDGEYLIPRLTRDQRRAAIEKPVSVGGGEISQRLVQRLLNDVGDDADQLPVLQHALMRIWENWVADRDADEPMDLRHYDEVGGLREALSNHADEVYEALPNDEQRQISRQLFKTLTERGEDERGIRRPTRLDYLSDIIGTDESVLVPLIEEFRKAGRTFLMPMEPAELVSDTVVDISHESLMRVWRRLSHWVDEESQSARIYRRLAETAALYQDGKAGVYHDPDLQIALSWRENDKPTQAWAERYHPEFQQAMSFLDVSHETMQVAERERELARQRELEQAQKLAEAERLRAEEQQRAAVRLKWLVRGLAVVTLLALGAGGLAIRSRGLAKEAQVIAEANEKKAEEQETLAKESANQATASAEVARKNARIARQAEDDADRSRDEAVKLRKKAEDSEELANQRAYLSDINVAQQSALQPGGADRVDELLNRWRPQTSLESSDRRRWEWYYLNASRGTRAQTVHPAIGWLWPIRWHPRRELFATAGSEGVILVWDIVTNKPVQLLHGHEGIVADLSWSPDGTRLASSGSDTTVRIWNLKTGLQELVFREHENGVPSVAWSGDGKRIASGSGGGVALIWLAENGTIEHRLKGHTNWLNQCAWNHDGSRLATASSDATARIWDANSGKPLHVLKVNDDRVLTVNFNPDGTKLASGGRDRLIHIWDVSSGKELGEPLAGHSGFVLDVAWHQDGRQLLSGSADTTVRIWDVERGSVSETFRGHGSWVNTVQWSPKHDRIGTSSFDRTVRIWDVQAPERIPSLVGHTDRVTAAAWSPDGQTLATAGMDNTIRIWDVSTRKESRAPLVGHSAGIWALDWHPDGKRLVSGGNDRKAIVWNVQTGEVVVELSDFETSVSDVAFDPAGKNLAVAAGRSGFRRGRNTIKFLRVWNVGDDKSAWKLRWKQKAHAQIYSVCWSPDGKRLASGGNDPETESDRIRIWDLQGKQLLGFGGVETRQESVFSLAWSPDGNHLASGALLNQFGRGDTPNAIRIWDVNTGGQLQELLSHREGVLSLDWNLDGARLVSGSADRTIKIWDWRVGHEILTLEGHDDAVTSVSWNRASTTLASASDDQTVRLWDATAGFQRENSVRMLNSIDVQLGKTPGDAGRRILRAKIYAGDGRWSEAAKDFEVARASNPAVAGPWLMSGWKVNGPQETSLLGGTAIEEAESQESDATDTGNSTDDWIPIAIGDDGKIDMGQYCEKRRDVSGYARTRIYSPVDQLVGLLLGSDDSHRVWCNGELVQTKEHFDRLKPDSEAVYLKLKKGWNSVLIKVYNETGGHVLFVRFSNNPLKMARGFERSNEWELAARAWDMAGQNPATYRPSILLNRVRANINAGQLVLAESGLTQLLKENSRQPLLLQQRARVKQLQGKWESAQDDIKRAVVLQPGDWRAQSELGSVTAYAQTDVLIPVGAVWEWFHPTDGVDPGEGRSGFHQEFYRLDFEESRWRKGRDSFGVTGGFGYGMPGGVNISRPDDGKLSVGYFRHRFKTSKAYSGLSLKLRFDDGVIVYLDGKEVSRSNMPSRKPEAFDLMAVNSGISGLVSFSLKQKLDSGEHILAFSLHNQTVGNWDLRVGEISLHGLRDGTVPLAVTQQPVTMLRQRATLATFGRTAGRTKETFSEILAQLPKQPRRPEQLARTLGEIAETFAQTGSTERAIAVLDHSIKYAPAEERWLTARSDLFLKKGLFKQAAIDMLKRLEISPEVPWHWPSTAGILALTGNTAALETLVARTVASITPELSVQEVEQRAKACLFRPIKHSDAEKVRGVVDAAFAKNRDSAMIPVLNCVRGMALYRCGDFQKARDTSRQCMTDSQARPFVIVQATLVAAMSEQQIKNHDVAKELLETAIAQINVPVEEFKGPSSAWVICRAMLQEVESVVGRVNSSPEVPKKKKTTDR